MVKDSYPIAKLNAPLTQQGVEQLQFVEEIASRHSAARITDQLLAHCLCWPWRKGVCNNEFSCQRQMIRAMARKLNIDSMRRNGTRKSFVNKSKQSATGTSKLLLYTRKVFDEIRNSLAQSVN